MYWCRICKGYDTSSILKYRGFIGKYPSYLNIWYSFCTLLPWSFIKKNIHTPSSLKKTFTSLNYFMREALSPFHTHILCHISQCLPKSFPSSSFMVFWNSLANQFNKHNHLYVFPIFSIPSSLQLSSSCFLHHLFKAQWSLDDLMFF